MQYSKVHEHTHTYTTHKMYTHTVHIKYSIVYISHTQTHIPVDTQTHIVTVVLSTVDTHHADTHTHGHIQREV